MMDEKLAKDLREFLDRDRQRRAFWRGGGWGLLIFMAILGLASLVIVITLAVRFF